MLLDCHCIWVANHLLIKKIEWLSIGFHCLDIRIVYQFVEINYQRIIALCTLDETQSIISIINILTCARIKWKWFSDGGMSKYHLKLRTYHYLVHSISFFFLRHCWNRTMILFVKIIMCNLSDQRYSYTLVEPPYDRVT